MNYWQFGDYVGIGAGAHGKISYPDKIERTAKLRSPKDYINASNKDSQRFTVTHNDLPFEFMMNALRLNLARIKSKSAGDKECAATQTATQSVPNNKENAMTKTLKVDGMMCNHCEMHVKKALEALDGVTEATANHENGEVTVTLSSDVPNDTFAKAIADAGYTFIG